MPSEARPAVSCSHATSSASMEPSPEFRVTVPRMAVIATDVFDAFMDRNALDAVVASGRA